MCVICFYDTIILFYCIPLVYEYKTFIYIYIYIYIYINLLLKEVMYIDEFIVKLDNFIFIYTSPF